MGGINNKQELLDRLSDGLFQGFAPDGTPMVFSIFDDMEKKRGQDINKKVGSNLYNFLKGSDEKFDTSPTEYIRIVSEGIELDTPEEVCQFLWHAGYMWGLLESATDEEKRKRDQEGDNQ